MDNEDKNINISSYNQSGGITAYNVNIGPQDRKLTEDFGEQLIQEIEKRPDKEIEILHEMGDGEAYRFAKQVRNFLIEKGYNPKGVNFVAYAEPIEGQVFKETNNSLEFIIGNKADW